MKEAEVLEKENAKLKADNKGLRNKINALKLSYDILLEQFKLAQQRQYAPRSEKHDIQPDLFDEAGDYQCVKPDEGDQPIDETIDVPAHKRIKAKRKSLPENLPREDVIHDISEAEKHCACGCLKTRFGEDSTEQLEVIPPQFKVIRHIRPKYTCKQCDVGGVAIAPMPKLLLPKSIAAPSLVAFTLISKYHDHLPLYRQSGIWKRYGIDISRNTMCGWLLSVADLCEPLWEHLRKHLLVYDYAQADETSVQVMKEPERKNTRKSYAWVYRGGCIKQRVVVYDYQETRSGQCARDFLAGFKGYLQTDGYKGYDWVKDKKDIIHLGCMAHARRPFAELVKILKKTGSAHQAVAYIQTLYKIEKLSRNKHPDERKALRDKEATPALDKLKAWLEKTVKGSPPQGKLGKGIRYMLDRWAELTNYLKDGRLEIDNNAIENAIRPFAIGRKNWMFMGSPSGARAGVIFYSLIMTCKANDIEPLAYFNYMLVRIRECKVEEDYKTLLPFNIDPSLLSK